VNRNSAIDMCRGMLFVLMCNTHALSLAQIDAAHWLRSDLWLPNGWATVAFVVLSGYGAGYLFSERRPEIARDRALRSRGMQIFAVMLVSNIAFALLRQLSDGHLASALHPQWWLGFVTLETPWTISGVLFPTATLLLLAPAVIRGVARAPYLVLAGLAACQLALSMLKLQLHGAELATNWFVRLLLTEGLGGFPLLPFLVNGCLGIWIGMAVRQRKSRKLPILGSLVVLQCLLYASTWWPETVLWHVLRGSFGAVAKFGCVYLLAVAAVHWLPSRMGRAIELIGAYALGSFVMHRIFLQTLAIVLTLVGAAQVHSPFYYVALFAGTLLLTWQLCLQRQSWSSVDLMFRRLAM